MDAAAIMEYAAEHFSDDDLIMLRLRFWGEGMTQEEIGEALGKDQGTISRHLDDRIDDLRRKFGEL